MFDSWLVGIFVYWHVHAQMHMQIHTHLYKRIHAYTYWHIHKHTLAHSYTHTHTHFTGTFLGPVSFPTASYEGNADGDVVHHRYWMALATPVPDLSWLHVSDEGQCSIIEPVLWVVSHFEQLRMFDSWFVWIFVYWHVTHRPNASVHTCTCRHRHTCTNAYTHTHTDIYTSTHSHIHTHIHIHISLAPF